MVTTYMTDEPMNTTVHLFLLSTNQCHCPAFLPAIYYSICLQ